jgi:hypothetical protein
MGIALLLWFCGCATVVPRFSQPVQADFGTGPMRVLTTDSLELYYPAPLKAQALRVAARMERCVGLLRGAARSPDDPRLVIYLTRADFNNAYVQPRAVGYPQQMVLPQHMTLEFFNLLGFGAAEIGDIGCHESVHYVQMQQDGGFWGAVNAVFGDVNTPNIFTESWFLEGLATVYEGRLGKNVGRPHSPIWNGLFEATVAAKGWDLGGGDLSSYDRDAIPFGGSYLVGEHFVSFLARRYGEEKLWALIHDQGSSVFSPFGVTLRFKAVYGKTIGALLDEYDAELKAAAHPVQRPATEKWVRQKLGPFPRMATSPDGAIAIIEQRRDDVPRLLILGPDGQERVRRRITPLLPPRRWIQADSELVSGMSFTRDGRWLFLVMSDLDSTGADVARLWKVDARSGEVVDVQGPLVGMGGSVRPDGGAYVYVRFDGNVANLVERDLASGHETALTHFTQKSSLGAPAYSPDGSCIAFSGWTGSGFDLFVREGSGALRQLTHDGRFNYGARWVDGNRLVFLREQEGHAQAHVIDLGTGAMEPVTQAPFVVMDPSPLPDGRLAFLDRDGLDFALAVAPLTGAEAPAEARTAAPSAISSTEGEAGAGAGASTDADADAKADADADAEAEAEAEAKADAKAGAGSSEQADAQAGAGATAGTVAQTEAAAGPALPLLAASLTAAPSVTASAPGSTESSTEPATLNLAAPSPLPAHTDAPYHFWDHLFLPNLRAPGLQFLTDPDTGKTESLAVSLSLQGQDRLGQHQWALNLSHTTHHHGPDFDFTYANAQLAPWYLAGTLARSTDYGRFLYSDDSIGHFWATDQVAAVSASRSFWNIPVSLSALGIRTTELDDDQRYRSQVVGGRLSASWSAGDGSALGGTQHALGLSVSTAYFPSALQSDFEFGDLRAQLAAVVPLPLSTRHALSLSVTARSLVGAPDALLRVGGIQGGYQLASNEPLKAERGLTEFFPSLTFSEYLRGYEDARLRTRDVAIANARYRYSLVLDHGWTSFLYLLPSLFVRQVDFEAFGAWARTRGFDTGNHRVAGGQISLRTLWGGALPISLYYQGAYRFDDGLGPLHIFGIALQ